LEGVVGCDTAKDGLGTGRLSKALSELWDLRGGYLLISDQGKL